ncbi:MAG TPA: hypothetical protein VMD48_14825 [Solirubrobacteraceae bacterium]|nr:hypothetical protein [Solirubrobacteraceae bacterium]
MDSDDRAGRPDTGERGADEALDDPALEDRAGDRAAAERGSGAGAGSGSAGGSAEDRLLQCERRHDRQECAHRPSLVVDLFAERAAAGTLAQVATEVGPAQGATM